MLRRIALATFFLAAACGSGFSVEKTPPASAAQVQLSFAPIVREAAPAVVNVYATRVVEQRVSPFFNDPFFRRFFGGQDGLGVPQQRVQRSLGSGVIIDASGILVTNNHVIANADEVKVALSDRREFNCDVILKDERTDLAILKMRDAKGPFPTLTLADSDEVEVGDLVLAIGDPFGVGQTVTSGIVSALARTQVGVSDYQFFIQTDAAINPGNSGGALIDMRGRLVGINTAIYSPSGGSIGVGFAIPSNMVKVVAESAKTGKTVKLPWIGANFQAVTPEIAEGLGLGVPRGVVVTDVMHDSPAAKAGLLSGDLVTAVDGVTVDDPSALNYRLATKGIGGSASLSITRGGKEYIVDVALVEAPELGPRDEVVIGDGSPLAGATVENLSPAVAEELGYSGTPAGVVISGIADGSVADSLRFRRGDRIAKVNGVAVSNTKQLRALTAKEADLWEVTIERGGKLLTRQFRG
jgi:Do/DeqQ family serine protease